MRYQHTQRGRFHWIVLAVGLLQIAAGLLITGPVPVRGLLVFVGLILAFLASCFAHLTVHEENRHLVVRFGPLPLVRRRVRYADIRSFERARSWLVDGWGIHWVPGRGWTWNLWGRDCVELTMTSGRLRIGTDDPDGLTAHLASRLRT